MSTENRMGPDETRLFEEFAEAYNAVEAENFERHIKPELQKTFTETKQLLTRANQQLQKVNSLIWVIAAFTMINCGIFLYCLFIRWR